MKLPWDNEELKEKIGELEEEIEDLEQQKNRWKNRFEAEEKRRKKLSREKQKAEEKLNRLEDKLDQENQKEENSQKTEENSFEKIEFESARKLVEKLDTVGSEQKDMVTLYCPDNLKKFSDLKALKNTVSKRQYERIEKEGGFIAFFDDQLGSFVLKLSPFYNELLEVSDSFELSDIIGFFEEEKHFVLVSAGNTKVYREEDGEVEKLDTVKSRVDRDHKKGGFSQGRFERKREEQINTHIEKVGESLDDLDEKSIYLLGDRKLCEELDGTYLGGFDPNRSALEKFYGPELLRF